MNETSGAARPRPFARSLDPIPGESLPGFLLRLSCRLHLTPARLAELTGLTPAGRGRAHLPAILLAGIPAPASRTFARVTRLTDDEAAQLGLATWQGRYPLSGTAPKSAAAALFRLSTRWVFAPATRYCPECLAGDGSSVQESFGGPWVKAWHLPVVFACPSHQRLLEHRCPECDQVVGGRRPGPRSALLPAMRVAGLHPAQCRAELTPSRGRHHLPACCGARLDQAGRRRPATPGLIALQGKILGLLDLNGPVSTLTAGLPAQPIRYFADLRAVELLACSTWPAARPFGPSEEAASAIDEHVASLRREAVGQQSTSSSSASRVRFDFPPADAAASGGLAHIADRVLAGSPDDVRERLRQLLPADTRKASRSYWGFRVVRSATACSEGLHAAYAPLLWGFTKAGSQPQGQRSAVLHPQRWGPENIPAFLPQDWYDRHFTPIDGVSSRFIRRTAALRLVQMAAGGSLGEAAGFLGIASRARRQPDLPGFETALEALARELDDPAMPLVSYRQRRQALETWCIDEDTWAGLIARLPTVPGPHRPEPGDCVHQVASIYLWVQLTSGEHRFAPRPIEAAQPPEVQEAWKGGRRSATWIRMHRSQLGSHYASLKAELNALSTSLARSIDTAAEPDHDVVP